MLAVVVMLGMVEMVGGDDKYWWIGTQAFRSGRGGDSSVAAGGFRQGGGKRGKQLGGSLMSEQNNVNWSEVQEIPINEWTQQSNGNGNTKDGNQIIWIQKSNDNSLSKQINQNAWTQKSNNNVQTQQRNDNVFTEQSNDDIWTQDSSLLQQNDDAEFIQESDDNIWTQQSNDNSWTQQSHTHLIIVIMHIRPRSFDSRIPVSFDPWGWEGEGG